MKNKYVIFWDIGNVLVKFKESNFENFFKNNRLRHLSEEEFNNNFIKIIGQSFFGEIDLYSTWDKLFFLTDLDKDKEEFAKQKFESFINADLLSFIKDQLNHCYIGIISDLHQIAYNSIITKQKDFFSFCTEDLIFLSNKTRKSKLAFGLKYFEEIFEIAKKYNKKILYIDDEIQYIDLANKLNVETVLFPKIDKKLNWNKANNIVINKMRDLDIV